MSEIKSQQKKKSFLSAFLEHLRMEIMSHREIVSATLIMLLVNVLSIKVSDLFTQIPTTYLTLAFLAVVLTIVLLTGVVVNRQQARKKNLILAELKKSESELFSRLEKNIPELIGIGETDEQPSAQSAT